MDIQQQSAVEMISAAHQRVKERYPKRELNKVQWRYFEACDDYKEAPGEKPQRFVVLERDELKAILGGNAIEAGKAIVGASVRRKGFMTKGIPQSGWYAQNVSEDGTPNMFLLGVTPWFFLGTTPEEAIAAYDSI